MLGATKAETRELTHPHRGPRLTINARPLEQVVTQEGGDFHFTFFFLKVNSSATKISTSADRKAVSPRASRESRSNTAREETGEGSKHSSLTLKSSPRSRELEAESRSPRASLSGERKTPSEQHEPRSAKSRQTRTQSTSTMESVAEEPSKAAEVGSAAASKQQQSGVATSGNLFGLSRESGTGSGTKRQSLAGLQEAESVFADESTDIFGDAVVVGAAKHHSQQLQQQQPATVTSLSVAKSPRSVTCLGDVLPVAPHDSGDRALMLEYAKKTREVLSNPKWAKEYAQEVEDAFGGLAALLEEWLSLDSPDRNELVTQYCHVLLAWVEYRLNSELPALKCKCQCTMEMTEKAEDMLRALLASSYVSWSSRASDLLAAFRVAKRRAIQTDSKVLTRLANVVQEQIKETRRLQKSLREKEAALEFAKRK